MVGEMGSLRTLRTYPFEISMDNPEVVKIDRAGHDLRELPAIQNPKDRTWGRTASGLTNCNRFAPGLDLAYSITFPFLIQAETMRKR